jgi:hypothetical protein
MERSGHGLIKSITEPQETYSRYKDDLSFFLWCCVLWQEFTNVAEMFASTIKTVSIEMHVNFYQNTQS